MVCMVEQALTGKGRMMKKLKHRWLTFMLLFVAGFVVMGGCPYTTKSSGLSHLRTMSVIAFKNETFYPGLSSDATNLVIQTFHLEGNLRSVPMERADCVFSGAVVDYRKEILREESLSRGFEYRITVTARVSFEDRRQNKFSFKDKILSGTWTYLTARGETEATGRREALRRLAQSIFAEVSERW